jgi:hypothetical protein
MGVVSAIDAYFWASYHRLHSTISKRFPLQKLGNKLGTTSAEHHQKPTRIVQDELRRINTIDNPTYLDTVEVIGSIPVAHFVSVIYSHSHSPSSKS